MLLQKQLNGHLALYNNVFTKPQYNNFQILTNGLLLNHGRKSILNISKTPVIYSKSQSSIQRFLTTSGWSENKLNWTRISHLQNNTKFKFSPKGFFIFDDTLIEEFGKQMDYVGGKHFDHTDGKYKKGRCIVSLLYYNPEEEIYYPIDFMIYYKIEDIGEEDFLTKNQIVEILLKNVKEQFLKGKNKEECPTVLMDSWYCGADLLSYINELGLIFIVMAKENRTFYVNGQKLKISEIFENMDLSKQYLKGYGIITIIRGKEEREERKNKYCYFFTNEELYTSSGNSAGNITIEKYRNRWKIEVMFKDVKQYFGWNDLSMRSSLGVVRFIYITFVGYTFVLKNALKEGIKTIGDSIKSICRQFFKRIIEYAYNLGRRSWSLLKILSSLDFKNFA